VTLRPRAFIPEMKNQNRLSLACFMNHPLDTVASIPNGFPWFAHVRANHVPRCEEELNLLKSGNP